MTDKVTETARALELAKEADEVSWRRLMKGSVLEDLLDLEIDLKRVGVKDPVGEDEVVLGTLDDFEIHMRALSLKYARMASLVRVKASYDCDTQEEEDQLMMQAETLKDIGKACMSLVWENIRVRLGVGPGYGTGVRDGIKIVRIKSKLASGNPLQALSKLLSEKIGGNVEIIGPIRSDDPED